MNRAERCRAVRIVTRPGDRALRDWVIVTDPGCLEELHRDEVAGAIQALYLAGPWSGETLMDCGCILSLIHSSEIPKA